MQRWSFCKENQDIRKTFSELYPLDSAFRPLAPRQGSAWLLDGRLQALCQGADVASSKATSYRDECRFFANVDYVDAWSLFKTAKLCDILITAFVLFQVVSHILLVCWPWESQKVPLIWGHPLSIEAMETGGSSSMEYHEDYWRSWLSGE